jgi:hypothetical protein
MDKLSKEKALEALDRLFHAMPSNYAFDRDYYLVGKYIESSELVPTKEDVENILITPTYK